MEVLGAIFPGARAKGGERTTRPSLPSKRLLAPLLALAHRAAGLDFREQDAGEESKFQKDLPGVEDDCRGNLSEDSEEWEDLKFMRAKNGQRRDLCFNDEEEDEDEDEDEDGLVG